MSWTEKAMPKKPQMPIVQNFRLKKTAGYENVCRRLSAPQTKIVIIKKSLYCIYYGQHGGAVANTVASQQEGSGFELMPAWVFSGYFGFLPESKDMQLVTLNFP